jgi:transcriptional regulator with XRE-family HTH domain
MIGVSDKNGIAGRLVAERADRGFSQTALAALARCSQRSIAEIEKGGSFSPRLLRDVASALGISEDWLRTGKGTKEVRSQKEEGRNRGREVRESPAAYAAPVNYEKLCLQLLPSAPEAWLREKINELISAQDLDGAQLLLAELSRRRQAGTKKK